MKKRRFYERIFLGLSLAFTFLSTAGCSRGPAPQNEQQGFIPYSLYGSQDGWEISCTARELTAEEKKEKLKELEADWENEKELLLSREGGKKQYQQIKEQHELLRRELQEKRAYVFTVTGICHDSAMDGKSFGFELTDENRRRVISGTQTASSARAGLWYESWQTETGAGYGMLIPPLKKAEMKIVIEGEEIIVPLELTEGKAQFPHGSLVQMRHRRNLLCLKNFTQTLDKEP